MKDGEKLRKIIKESFYKKGHYEVTVPLEMNKGMLSMFALPLSAPEHNIRAVIDTKEFFALITPEFQRENDKWTREMQQRFVENLLIGVSSRLIMYQVVDKKNKDMYGVYVDCRLLDGLQRLTAINAWLDGEFPIFEDIYYTEEECKSILRGCNGLTVRVYTLDSLEDAVQFYIQMNENISHSEEDINKARRYIERIQNDTTRH